MKFVSWNVNGLRACLTKGFTDYFTAADADFFCLQETKMQEGQADVSFPDYRSYWNSAVKKGYSGTAVFTRIEPLAVTYDFGPKSADGKRFPCIPGESDPYFSGEGRVITLEFDRFFLVTVYTPNSKDQLARLSYRMEWEDAFREYLLTLDGQKPVVVCGDLNVAHEEIDLKNPKTNRKNAGFSDEERAQLTKLLSSGFLDSFRCLHPDEIAYSWWSYRYNARKNNAGWRIDYFLTSERLRDSIVSAGIRGDITGSDHCPVTVELSL